MINQTKRNFANGRKWSESQVDEITLGLYKFSVIFTCGKKRRGQCEMRNFTILNGGFI